MNALSYYSGYDQYCLVKRLERKAVTLDPTQTIHLKDTAIQINTLSKSVSRSKTALDHATIELHPILRELCLLVQKVVFWYLGIDALESSIDQKRVAIDGALQAALLAKEEMLEISPAAEFFWKGEFIPVTIEPQKAAIIEPLQASGFVVLNDQFQIRIRGRVVMILRELEPKIDIPKTLLAVMQSKNVHWIEPLVQIAMEIVQREEDIERLEIQADESYTPVLEQLQFSVQHQPDVVRTVSGGKKDPFTPDRALKAALAKEEEDLRRQREEAAKKAAVDEPPPIVLPDDKAELPPPQAGEDGAHKQASIDAPGRKAAIADRVILDPLVAAGGNKPKEKDPATPRKDKEVEIEQPIWWLDKPKLNVKAADDEEPFALDPADHPLVKEPVNPLVFKDMPTLNQLRNPVPV